MSSTALFKKLVGESLIYGVSGIISRFISIFLTPIYTNIFVPSDYGIVSLVSTVYALLSILLILGLDNSLARWYYDNESESDRLITLNTFLWSCCGFAALLSFVVIVFHHFIATVIFRESATAPLLILMSVNLPLTVFSVFTINILRMQRRAVATATFTLTTSLLTIAFNLLFIVVLRWGLPGVFYAQIGTSIIAVVWTFVLFRKEISLRLFDRQRWVKMFIFSMPLIPGSVAFWVVNLSGAYFIQLINNTHEVGLFQIGTTLASVMALVSGAFQLAWSPFAYSIHKRSEAKQIYAQALLLFLSTTCLMSLGIMLFAPEILLVLTNPNYYDAALVGGLLAFNHILIGLTSIASIGTSIAKNNKAFGIATLVSAGLLVALNLLLVPRYGKEGAAISILLSQSVVPLAIFAHGQKIYPIPYKFGKALFTLSSSFVLGVVGLMVLSSWSLPLALNVCFKISIIIFYSALLFFTLRSEIKHQDFFAGDVAAG